MAINSTHHDDGSAISQEPRLIDLRFSLRRLMTKTALADIFWANDLHGAADNVPEKNVLVLLVNPALANLSGFTTAWQQILGRPSPPAAAYPDVIAYGEHEGDYWLALNNVSGILLSERISELDERGIPLNNALDTLHNIHQTLDSIQAGAYGYIEPGVLQYTERGSYKILNAPLVKVMQLLTSARKGTINQLALHSAYLSPSVSVGDVPVTEDDTFSTASMLYTMLSGRPPFGGQSTLTAVAHGDTPPPLNKLKKQSWEAVEQALTYQRSARPENPEKFLALLKQSNRRKVIFPLAALAALGVAVFAGQHLVSRLGEYMPAGGLLSGKQQGTGDTGLLSNPSGSVAVPSTQAQQPSQTDTQSQLNANKANNSSDNGTTTLASDTNDTANEADDNANNANSQASAISTADSGQPVVQPEQAAANNNNIDNTQATNTARNTNDDAGIINQAVDQPVAAAATNITPQSDSTDDTGLDALATINNSTQSGDTVDNSGADNTNANTAAATTSDNNSQDNPQDNAVAVATPASTTSQNNSAQQQTINQLLQQAVAAFNVGQLEDSDSGKQGAISLLRELAAIDDANPEATALIGKVVEKKYQLAERRLGSRKFAEAETLVQDSDQLIREFMLTDKLQRQVRMESKVSILREEQAQVDDLLRDARTAINLGTLSQSDGQDHALSYLRRVLFKQPGNTEAGKMLTEIASIRQQAVYSALNNGELTQAKTYLRESGRLIQKYKLKGLRADQKAIETRYEAAVNQNGNNAGTTPNGNVGSGGLTSQQADQQQADTEAETARQRQLRQQAAAEIARQRQLQAQANAEAEAARQRQLQQQAQAAEAARQRQLQQQAQAEAEAARQRQLQQQQAAVRQQQLQQQQAAARQRQLQQQQAAARQRQLQQQAAARQQQLQQQQTQTVDGYIIDENGYVIGEPPLADDYVDNGLDDGVPVIAIPVQRLQPNTIGVQEIAPDGSPQAVPVWEDQTLQQIQPVGAAAVDTQLQQPDLQAQFDNFQAQANAVDVPFPNEEIMVPELQEVPLSAIEGILPGQVQQ